MWVQKVFKVLVLVVSGLSLDCWAYKVTVTNLIESKRYFRVPRLFSAAATSGTNLIEVRLPEFAGAVVEFPKTIDRLVIKDMSVAVQGALGDHGDLKRSTAGLVADYSGANLPVTGSDLYIIPKVDAGIQAVYKKDLDAALRAWLLKDPTGAGKDIALKMKLYYEKIGLMKKIDDWRESMGMRRLFDRALYEKNPVLEEFGPNNRSLQYMLDIANKRV